MINFKIKPHNLLLGVSVVEILIDGKVAGVIYPESKKSIRLVSAHIEEAQADAEFSGEVAKDDGSGSWPPIPSLRIKFNPGPYTIVGNNIVKL